MRTRSFKFLPMILAIFLATASCGSNKSSSLSVSVIPNTLILVPKGDGIYQLGIKLSAPWFVWSSIVLSYTGEGVATVMSIEFKLQGSAGSASTFNCVIAGDTLAAMFPFNVTSTGQVQLTKGATIQGKPFGCSNVTVPDVNADSFNLAFMVRVVGVAQSSATDPNSVTGRTTGTTHIVVQ